MINTKDSDIRIIKKYPNRRLYDETDSRYINFSDLHKMILDGKEFKVIVDKTNEDQTLKLMLQIFLDLELGGHQLFSDQSLKSLIILSNSPGKQLVNTFLKTMLAWQSPK
jgi:polyhydroxyalkanoate synthesis repressor PhaR